MSIADNLERVHYEIQDACARAHRDPATVALMAVCKMHPAEAILEAQAAGQRLFGENRVQEFAIKQVSPSVPVGQSLHIPRRSCFHLIGPLQNNKTTKAAQLFDAVDTIVSHKTAERLSAAAIALGKSLSVLVEVKVSPEDTKHGVTPDELPALLAALPPLPGISVCGLMTVPPFDDDPETARPYFQQLRHLRDENVAAYPELTQLSMGMSNDFRVAIEEGSTTVRVGTAIFGKREVAQTEQVFAVILTLSLRTGSTPAFLAPARLGRRTADSIASIVNPPPSPASLRSTIAFWLVAVAVSAHFALAYALTVPRAWSMRLFAYGPVDFPYRRRILMRWLFRGVLHFLPNHLVGLGNHTITTNSLVETLLAFLSILLAILAARLLLVRIPWQQLNHRVARAAGGLYFSVSICASAGKPRPGALRSRVCRALRTSHLRSLRAAIVGFFIRCLFSRRSTANPRSFLPFVFFLFDLNVTLPLLRAFRATTLLRYAELVLQLVLWAAIPSPLRAPYRRPRATAF